MSIMNSVQQYYSFRCKTDCGISKVRLLGTEKDWRDLKAAAANLDDYGLSWWTPGLIEILDQIIATYTGTNNAKQNKDFWQYIFKYYHGVGSGINPSVDGWIISFIPYINNEPSPLATRSLKQIREQVDDGDAFQANQDDKLFMEAVDFTQPGLDVEKLKRAVTGIN